MVVASRGAVNLCLPAWRCMTSLTELFPIDSCDVVWRLACVPIFCVTPRGTTVLTVNVNVNALLRLSLRPVLEVVVVLLESAFFLTLCVFGSHSWQEFFKHFNRQYKSPGRETVKTSRGGILRLPPWCDPHPHPRTPHPALRPVFPPQSSSFRVTVIRNNLFCREELVTLLYPSLLPPPPQPPRPHSLPAWGWNGSER